MGYDDYSPYRMQLDGRCYTSSSDSRYKFIGVERDAETGLDHKGDRSYDSRLGRSTSIDPFVMKSPGLSPYSYAGNNPIIAIDLNGDEVWIYDLAGDSVQYTENGVVHNGNKKLSTFLLNVIRALDEMQLKGAGILVDALIDSKGKYRYFPGTTGGNGSRGSFNPASGGALAGGDIFVGQGEFGTVAHESYHGYENENGMWGPRLWSENQAYGFEYLMDKACGYTPIAFGINDGLNMPGSQYTDSMNEYVKKFDNKSMERANDFFFDGSQANVNGVYNPLKNRPYTTNWPYQKGSLLKQAMGK